jgi:hypothetical protein
MDIEGTVECGDNIGEKGDFRTVGERIYAICYRKVVLKFLKDIRELTPSLKPGNHWTFFSQKFRGQPQQGEVVEANIEEEDYDGEGEDNFEEDDDGGCGHDEIEVFVDGEEKFVLLPPRSEHNEDD